MIKKRSLLSLILMIIPLLITIGVSTWIIVYEIIITPNEIASTELPLLKDHFDPKYFDSNNPFTTIYNGNEQYPVPTKPINDLQYKYSEVTNGSSEFIEGKPINAGTYEFNISATGYTSCNITFIINKADPTISVNPTLPAIYQGMKNVSFNGGVVVGVKNDENMEGTFSYKNAAGTSSATYIGTSSSSPNSSVDMVWTPKPNTLSAQNYNVKEFKAPITLYPVAYIDDKYYGTVEAALSAAQSGDTVYIITYDMDSGLRDAEKDEDGNTISYPIITNNCEIKSGVTLTLPYNGKQYDGRQSGESNWFDDLGGDFVDSTQAKVTQNLKCSVTISPGVQLINNGRINIGGITGHEGQGLSAHTSGHYAQILMDSNAILENFGTIDCLGYIKEKSLNNSSKIISQNGTINLPLVIYDYRGGSSTAGAYQSGNITPFNIFDFPNIQVELTNYSTSKIIGYADLYTGKTDLKITVIPAQHNTTNVNIIGSSNSLINLKSGSYLVSKYSSESLGLTLKGNTSGKTLLKIYGGVDTGTLSLKVKTGFSDINVSTENTLFPISWKYNIELYDGVYNLQNKMKFLTGSRLYVNNDATLNITKDTIFYSSFTDTAYANIEYPSDKEAAIFMANGKVNISSAFGGEILTSKNDAFLTINSSQLEVSSAEGHGTRDGLSFNFVKAEKSPFIEVARGPGAGTPNFVKGPYISDGSKWLTAEGYTNYTITFNANGGVFNSGNTTKTEEYPIKENTSTTISSFGIEQPTKVNYKFLGWYEDSECTRPIKDKVIKANDNLTVYARWDAMQYNIIYMIDIDDKALVVDYINTNETTYNIESGEVRFVPPEINTPNVKFYGWYFDSEYTIRADSSYQANKLYEHSMKNNGGGSIVLYGYFSEKNIYTIRFHTQQESITINDINVLENSQITNLDEITNPLKEKDTDYNFSDYFDGWYTSVTPSEGILFDASNIVNADLVHDINGDGSLLVLELYAYWIPKCILSYKNDDNTNKIEEYYKTGSKVSLKSSFKKSSLQTDETSIIYTFSVWKNDGNDYLPNSTYEINSNITFIASYSEVTAYRIKFENVDKATVEVFDENQTSIGNNSSADGIYVMPNTHITFIVKFNESDERTFKIDNDTNLYSGNSNPFSYSYEMPSKKISITATSKKSCVAAGTLITMSDGSKKKVEDLTYNDKILAWDFVTGKIVVTVPSILFKHEKTLNDKIDLLFSDGSNITILNDHEFFDLTLNEFVNINVLNYNDFIGHKFVTVNSENYDVVTLIHANYEKEECVAYSLQSAIYNNFISNDLLSRTPPAFEGWFDYFEIGDNLKYDEEKMALDIEKYGLCSYEEYADYVTYDQFIAFNGQYINILIGKGIVTKEDVIYLIKQYVS